MTSRRTLSQPLRLGLTMTLAAIGLCLMPSATFAQTTWLEQILHGRAPWLWFVGAFLAGLALNLTPCVYPMVPVTLAFFSGQATGRPAQTVRLGIFYVIGMSTTYALLGLLAANTGALLGSWLQQPAVLIGVAGLMGALALSMFGLYELRAPNWIAQRLGHASVGSVGALIMGLTVGLIAAPCIGPFVLGLMVFVSQLAQPTLGFALFFVMGLGMGTPYVLLGLAANKTSRLPKAGPWLVWVKHALGIALLGLGLHFLRPLINHDAFRWIASFGLLGAGLYLGWLMRLPAATKPSGRSSFAGARAAAGALLVVTALSLKPWSHPSDPGVAWEAFSPQRLAQAKQEGRPVLVDVYADWCIPCIELDHVTFSNPAVQARIKPFVTMRIDVTRQVPENAQELLERLEIVGVPTVLLFDANGQERPEARVTGFTPPDAFLARLRNVTSASAP